MTDLYLAALVLALVSFAAFALGVGVGRRVPRIVATALAGLALVGSVWFLARVWGDVRLAAWLPFTGLPVLVNVQAPLMGFMGGLVWVLLAPVDAWRRGLLEVALAVATAWSGYRPYIGPEPPVMGVPVWGPGGVLVQTSDATCSPAAAVTLLALVGIESSEREMTQLCLTTANGTSNYALYRGLRLKLHGTGYTIVPFRGSPAELATTGDPAIVTVGLRPDQQDVDPRYVMDHGWTPGLQHTVVVFGFHPDGRADIGDPSVGRETWTPKDLRVLWHGQGFRLVKIG